MSKLFLIGGPPRVGKSLIMQKLIKQHPMHLLATDAIQEGVRSLFVDNPFQILENIKYSGTVEYFQGSGADKKTIKQEFDNNVKEKDIAYRAIDGFLDHYKRNDIDLALEGIHITPKWVSTLNQKDFDIKVAFVGYLNESHLDSILNYAKNNKSDWVNEWLINHDNDETYFKDRFRNQIESNKITSEQANNFGFQYFDVASMPFEEYVQKVVEYLIN